MTILHRVIHRSLNATLTLKRGVDWQSIQSKGWLLFNYLGNVPSPFPQSSRLIVDVLQLKLSKKHNQKNGD